MLPSPNAVMKFRIVVGAVVWTLVITVLHLWSNVGMARFGDEVQVWLGLKRPTLRVAFLPVT